MCHWQTALGGHLAFGGCVSLGIARGGVALERIPGRNRGLKLVLNIKPFILYSIS